MSESSTSMPASASSEFQIQALSWPHPFQWLRSGASDLRRSMPHSLLYGLCFWLMARTVAWVFSHNPEYTLSITSGCLLLGPFLAMGLYALSREGERQAGGSAWSSWVVWRHHVRSMGMMVLLLLVLELLWGRASLVVFAVFFNTGWPSTAGVLEVLFNPDNLEFVLVYVAVGGVFASLVYATTVVSIPMILDRDTDAVTAAITSFRVVYAYTAVMLLWAALIVGMVALALMLPLNLGLVLVGPWLGHASWHAYRGCVVSRAPVQDASLTK